MRFWKIEPKHKTEQLIKQLKQTLEKNYKVTLYKTSQNSFNMTLMLKEAKPYTLKYQLSKNYIIISENGKLYAQNVHFPDLKLKIKKMYYLNEENWIEINETINTLCNQLGISANVKSALIWIRKGNRNVWHGNYVKLLKDNGIPKSKALRRFELFRMKQNKHIVLRCKA